MDSKGILSISRREFLEASGKGLLGLGLSMLFFQGCPVSKDDFDSWSLWMAINEFRKWAKGLPPIPLSKKLEKVAQAHVKDINTYHPEKNCIYLENGKKKEDGHAWSKHSGHPYGCYRGNLDQNGKPVSHSPDVMEKKPNKIANYQGIGYEIACVSTGKFGSEKEHDAVDEALHSWTGWVWGKRKGGNRIDVKMYSKDPQYFGYLKQMGDGSKAHTDVILQQGQWAQKDWKALGAAVSGSFACAWFGEIKD
jgi:hypothetical protein